MLLLGADATELMLGADATELNNTNIRSKSYYQIYYFSLLWHKVLTPKKYNKTLTPLSTRFLFYIFLQHWLSKPNCNYVMIKHRR